MKSPSVRIVHYDLNFKFYNIKDFNFMPNINIYTV
jgi:hypothetical protein